MSWLSKALGLDNHPQQLQQINLDLRNLGVQVADGVIVEKLGPVAGPIIEQAANAVIQSGGDTKQATITLQANQIPLLESTAYAVARKLGLSDTVTEAQFDAEANAALALLGLVKVTP